MRSESHSDIEYLLNVSFITLDNRLKNLKVTIFKKF